MLFPSPPHRIFHPNPADGLNNIPLRMRNSDFTSEVLSMIRMKQPDLVGVLLFVSAAFYLFLARPAGSFSCLAGDLPPLFRAQRLGPCAAAEASHVFRIHVKQVGWRTWR